tara:strand:+ start:3198 stop:4181 length:984 start_codon:yes stop_codon:yes gene_type:complete
MTFDLGAGNIAKIQLNTIEIKKALVGSTLVYDATGGGGGPVLPQGWSQTETGLAGISNSVPSTCGLNATSIAITSQSDETLRVYTRGTYAQRGSSISIGGTLNSDNQIAYLADNEIMASRNGTNFQKYIWNDGASTWSTDGAIINLGNDCVVVGASSTRIFAYRRSGEIGVSCYDLIAGTWTKVGSTKTYVVNLRRQGICILDKTADAEVLVIREYQTGTGTENKLIALSFNGSAFTEITSIDSGVASDSTCTMAGLNTTSFAVIGNINKFIEYWTFTSNTFAFVEEEDVSSNNSPTMGLVIGDTNTVTVGVAGGAGFSLQEYVYTP